MNTIFDEMKKVTSLFLDIVYKLKNNGLKIRNIVLTRCFESSEKKFEQLYWDKLISENGVGLKLKGKEKITNNLLVYSYFIDDKRLNDFIYNLEKEIDNLYNIWV